MNFSEYAWLIVLSPLAGFIINGFFGKYFSEKVTGLIGSLASTFSFVISCLIFFEFKAAADKSAISIDLFKWIAAGKINVAVGYQIDSLSIIMALVVTGVGSLIHFYSIGYMHGEKGFARYFAYLNLFMFSMLNLILGNNILLMFLGWEGVGLCSYLLIGYYYETDYAPTAGKKAFVVNRIGDFGFLIGIFMILNNFGTLNFTELSKAVTGAVSIDKDQIFWITLMLFVGAAGKSAQIPLYVWLPDAMAGPTPVSALIHAATMVTSGIYMISRLNFLYVLAPSTMAIVAVVGGLTALFAATIGTQQNDIKKVLAYSTVSQLGYMFMGVGVGAFSAGIFHLMTHAFFKALLFLGSGAVIYALHHEQDIRNMGGLRKKLPITFLTFLMGTLAIAGTPLFSGFFSKDEILWKVFNYNIGLFCVGALAAMLTAFYMFRLVFVTFFGEMRYHEHGGHHVHEAPAIMTVPLIILAVLSVFGGFLGIPHILDVFHAGNSFEHFLSYTVKDSLPVVYGAGVEWGTMIFSVCIAAIGFFIAYTIYIKKKYIPGADSTIAGFKKIIYNKYYVDEFYEWAIVSSIVKGSKTIYEYFDKLVVDGLVNGVGRTIRKIGESMRSMQTGMVGDYMLSMIIGASILLAYIIVNKFLLIRM